MAVSRRPPQPLPRLRGYLSEQDAAWWDSLVGSELSKPFRDRRSLLDVLLRLGRVYVGELEAQDRVPVVVEEEWTVRINESMRLEDAEFVERIAQPRGRASQGQGGEYLYVSQSAMLADFIQLGRGFVPLVLDLEQTFAKGRARASVATRSQA